MRFIVCLGNPGAEYAGSRHNFGFMLGQAFVDELGLKFKKTKFVASIAVSPELDALFICPQTFMNKSGEALGSVVRYYQGEPKDVLVLYDDLDLPLGRIRFAADGGPGGHRGMASVLEQLGTQLVHRLKLGIGRPPEGRDPVDFVLKSFTKAEKVLVDEVIEKGKKALRQYLDYGLVSTMNQYNRFEKEQE